MTPREVFNQAPIFYLTFCGTLQVSTALTVASNLLCFSMCATNLACRGHRFFRNVSTNNCELVIDFKPYSSPLNAWWLIEETIEPTKLFGTKKFHGSDIALKASSAGFDVTLELSNEMVFLKRVDMSISIKDAQFECLGLGGILPIEDSD